MDSTTGSGARDGRRGGDTYEWSSLRSGPFGTGQDVSDPWAWVSVEPPDEAPRDLSGAHVTAVLVALDAARWLAATLDGLDRLRCRPDRLIAIDNGSADATLTLLEWARDRGLLDAVYSGEPGSGFGNAVRSALQQDRESALLDSDPGRPPARTAGGCGCCTTTAFPRPTPCTTCSTTSSTTRRSPSPVPSSCSRRNAGRVGRSARWASPSPGPAGGS